MAKAQRTKGASFEREVCKFLRDELGEDIFREIGQCRDGGCDIKLGAFNIECKRRSKIAIYEWWDQVVKSLDDDTLSIPILCIRADRRDRLWVVDDQTMAMFLRGEID